VRSRFVWAVGAPALLGAAVLTALLPWGDPCSFDTVRGCAILFAPSQQPLRNAVFLTLCIVVGCGAGLMIPVRRFLAGGLSVPLAVLVAIFGAHVVYRLSGPLFRSDLPGFYRATLLAVTALVALGVLGGALSRYIRRCFG
jgi:hypothetical protein